MSAILLVLPGVRKQIPREAIQTFLLSHTRASNGNHRHLVPTLTRTLGMGCLFVAVLPNCIYKEGPAKPLGAVLMVFSSLCTNGSSPTIRWAKRAKNRGSTYQGK